MLKLHKGSAEPVTYRPFTGVEILIRPLDTMQWEAAQAEALRMTGLLRECAGGLEKYGLDGAEFLKDGALAAGTGAYLLNVEYAVRAIIGWQGIGDETGAVIPEPTPDAIATLMKDAGLAAQIVSHALSGIHQWVAEGNVSAGSRNGAREPGTTAGTVA